MLTCHSHLYHRVSSLYPVSGMISMCMTLPIIPIMHSESQEGRMENVGHIQRQKQKEKLTSKLSHSHSSVDFDSIVFLFHIQISSVHLPNVWNLQPRMQIQQTRAGYWETEGRKTDSPAISSQNRPCQHSSWLIIQTYIWRWIAKLIIDRDAVTFSGLLVVSGGLSWVGLFVAADEGWGQTLEIPIVSVHQPYKFDLNVGHQI